MARPTKYDPKFCKKVIDLGREGASKAEMALELDLARSTFDLYEHEHKEFSEAVKQAVALSQGWWEKNGRLAVFNSKDFNATAYIFNMKNRFKEDWSDTVINKTTLTAEQALYDAISGKTETLPE